MFAQQTSTCTLAVAPLGVRVGGVEPWDAKIRRPKSGKSGASEGGRASAGEDRVGEEAGRNLTGQFDSPTSAVQDSAIYVSFPPLTRRRRPS